MFKTMVTAIAKDSNLFHLSHRTQTTLIKSGINAVIPSWIFFKGQMFYAII
jgi:hypothetical protein